MTIQEAIEHLRKIAEIIPSYCRSEAFEVVIKAAEKVETLEAENAKLKINAEKWADLLKRAGAVGLNETDFFKMVETDKE